MDIGRVQRRRKKKEGEKAEEMGRRQVSGFGANFYPSTRKAKEGC